MAKALALFALCLFLEIQLFTYVPQIGRRIGPWSDLRTLLSNQASEVVRACEDLGISTGQPLSRADVETLDALVFNPRPKFTFPLVDKTVELRLMSGVYPYAGVDYGNGRNCVFDLKSMRATECD